ncbi:MAG TPA: hypothetical protein VKB79_16640 [Bryobacteraceae bacterium]|nr:hypothetical protein [Bryobacteraceae bacterium]
MNKSAVNKAKLQAGRDKITAPVAVMSEHDRAVYFDFINAIVDDLNPRNFLERQIARRVAQDNWRLNRLHAIEENVFTYGHSGPYKSIEAEHPQIHHAMVQALTFIHDPRLFALIALYEARITRNMHANLKTLFHLQSLPMRERELRNETPEIARSAAGQFVLQSIEKSRLSSFCSPDTRLQSR